MFRRLAALFVFGMFAAGGALAQQQICSIDNDLTGAVDNQPGNYNVTVPQGKSGTLSANCTNVNSYNWNPGNIQTAQIPVTASGAPGTSSSYTLTGCSTILSTCAAPVTITIEVTSASAPDCTLAAAPNPVVSGGTVNFTVSCNPSLPQPAYLAFRDLSGNFQSTSFAQFTDTAPVVAAQKVINVIYQPVGPGNVNGTEKVVQVTVIPPVQPPSNCSLAAQPNPVVLGSSTTLTATCTGGDAPTSYTFLDGNQNVIRTASSNTLVVTPPNLGNNQYAVRASNAGGQAPSVAVQVNVLPPPPTGCTASAAPNPIALGTQTLLTGTCTGGGAVSSYAFSYPDGTVVNGSIIGGAPASAHVTPVALGTQTFKFVATNAGGSSAPATVDVIVQPPSCTINPSVPNPVARNTSVTLTAACNNQPGSYSWSTAAGAISGAAGASITVSPAASTQYTVTATNASQSLPVTATGRYTINVSTGTTVTAIPGAALTGVPGRPLARALQVRVTDVTGAPVAQELVNWSVVNPGASPGTFGSNPSPATDAQGLTSNTFTMGSDGGGRTLRACLAALPTACADFTVAPGASVITTIAGTTITGTPGRPLSRELQVRVADQSGAPFAGEVVNWSVVNPGPNPGTFAAASSAPSDAQGIARNTFTMGTDPGGRTLRACLTSLPAVCADFQVLQGASVLTAISGATLVGTPGKPLARALQVRATDAQGNPVAQESVNWTVVNPGSSPGTFGANPSPATDAQGLTSNTFTMGNDGGGRTLRACLASLPTACADFQVVPGTTGLVAIAGTPLVGAPGKPLSRDMQVRATDAQGNGVAGELVNWTVVNPGASPGTFAASPSAPTDAQGITRNTFTMGNDAGGRTLRACLASQPAICADFAVRSLNDAVIRPTAKIMSPLAELALATPLAQLNNVRFRLEQLRLRRNPAVLDALRVSVAGQALPAFSAFAFAPVDKNGKPVPQKGGGAAADDPFERLGFFVNGEVQFGKQSATGIQNGYDLNTRGVTLGADYRLPGDSVVGLAAGFMNASTDLADAGGSQSARGYSLSAYGSFTPVEGAYIDVIAHAGGNKYDTRRREVSDAGSPLDYNSNTRGTQYALAVSAGADFNRGPLTMNPYVRLDYVNAKINRFSESGDAGALAVGDLDLKNTVATLGGQLSYAISTSWGVLMPNTRLELQRRLQGDGRNVSAQLVADGTINALVPLENVDRDYGTFSVGFSAVLPRGVSGFANYERLFGREGYSNSKYTVGVRFEF